MTDVTHILGQIEQGDPSAAEKLLPLVYEELRKLAAAEMGEEHLRLTEMLKDLFCSKTFSGYVLPPALGLQPETVTFRPEPVQGARSLFRL